MLIKYTYTTDNKQKDNNTSISSHSFKHEYLQTSPIRGIKFESYSARKELNKTKKSDGKYFANFDTFFLF